MQLVDLNFPDVQLMSSLVKALGPKEPEPKEPEDESTNWDIVSSNPLVQPDALLVVPASNYSIETFSDAKTPSASPSAAWSTAISASVNTLKSDTKVSDPPSPSAPKKIADKVATLVKATDGIGGIDCQALAVLRDGLCELLACAAATRKQVVEMRSKAVDDLFVAAGLPPINKVSPTAVAIDIGDSKLRDITDIMIVAEGDNRGCIPPDYKKIPIDLGSNRPGAKSVYAYVQRHPQSRPIAQILFYRSSTLFSAYLFAINDVTCCSRRIWR